jgi:hypothetical protein
MPRSAKGIVSLTRHRLGSTDVEALAVPFYASPASTPKPMRPSQVIPFELTM